MGTQLMDGETDMAVKKMNQVESIYVFVTGSPCPVVGKWCSSFKGRVFVAGNQQNGG